MHNTNILNFPKLYAFFSKFRKKVNYEKILYLEQINKGNVVLDIGANRGYYTYLFSHLVAQNGQVHAFEPVPETFLELEGLNVPFDNIFLMQAAVGRCSSKATIKYDLNDSEKASLVNSNGTSKYETKIVSIDEYMLKYSLTTVNFIKCDVEGFELDVIQGGLKTLRKYKPALSIEITIEKKSAIKLIDELLNIGYKKFKKIEKGFPAFDIEKHNFKNDEYFYLYASY